MTGGIIGSDTNIRHLAPYTGNYTVHGWKHVISSSEISTSLFLIRDGFGASESEGKTTLRYVRESLEATKADIEAKYSKFNDKKPTLYQARMDLIERKLKKNPGMVSTFLSWIDKAAVTAAENARTNGTDWIPEDAGIFEKVELLSPRDIEKRKNGDDKEIAALQKLIDQLPQ